MAAAIDERLTRAQEAEARHAWREAYDLLRELDDEGLLGGPGLELLGTIAWWVQEPDVSVAARERAYSAYLAEGEPTRAAYMALIAAQDHHTRLSDAVAQGWSARAARILKDEPESFAHGYLAFFEALQAAGEGDFTRASELGARAVEIGTRFGDKDLQGFGLLCQGTALVRGGDPRGGLSLLDEATAAAVAGELTPFATGVVYCQTISTCRDLADYRRAGQWTEVAARWCERQSINGFPGICRVHRAEILALRGEWTDAQEEALRASEELLTFREMYLAGEGFYTLGEIRLRLGDMAGADEAFRQAQDLGKEPQPGRALLYLAQGRNEAASASIARALSGTTDRLTRAKLLLPQVEIVLSSGDVEAARAAAAELSAIAEDFGSPSLNATAHCAEGLVHLAAQEPEEALAELNRARSHWQAMDAPYEAARVRAAIAEALHQAGETDDATVELEAARAGFERLGATLDAMRTTRRLDEWRGRAEQGERLRRTFMFTDIVGSTELIAAIGDEAWNDLVRWHDQTLRGLAAAHGGEEVNHAGDGFFLSFSDVESALTCAVAIQQELADHRRKAGFAPRVRIGVHADDATKVGTTYLGQGVHQAARVGALAGAGEIVATAQTLEGLTTYAASEPRAVELKGIPGEVQVQTLLWSAGSA